MLYRILAYACKYGGRKCACNRSCVYYDGEVNVGFKNIFLKLFVGSAIIGTVVAIPLAFLPMPVAQKTSSSIHVKDRWWDVNER